MNRITKYALIGTGVILLLVLLTLEKKEIKESNSVITLVDAEGNRIESPDLSETKVKYSHPDEEMAQKVTELFEAEFQKSITPKAEPAETLNSEAAPQN